MLACHKGGWIVALGSEKFSTTVKRKIRKQMNYFAMVRFKGRGMHLQVHTNDSETKDMKRNI